MWLAEERLTVLSENKLASVCFPSGTSGRTRLVVTDVLRAVQRGPQHDHEEPQLQKIRYLLIHLHNVSPFSEIRI